MLTLNKLINFLSGRQTHNKKVIVRVDGRDHAAVNVTEALDNVLGKHVVIHTESLSEHV